MTDMDVPNFPGWKYKVFNFEDLYNRVPVWAVRVDNKNRKMSQAIIVHNVGTTPFTQQQAAEIGLSVLTEWIESKEVAK